MAGRAKRTTIRRGASALVALAMLIGLTACEPGDRIPVVTSVVVQPDQETIRVTWNALRLEDEVSSYEVWYRPTGTTTWLWSSTGDVGADHRSWVPVAPGTTTYVQDFRALGIQPDQTYDIAVRSMPVGGGTGTSLDAPSARATVTTSAPAPTSTRSADGTSITMSWPSTSMTPWHEWRFHLSPGATATPAVHSTSTVAGQTSTTFTGLTPGAPYTVGLSAVQAPGAQHVPAVRTEVRVASEGWVQTWADEFDGTTLDPQRWNVLNSGIGNYYSCMRPSNVQVAGGTLRLIAKSEAATCNGGQALPYTGSYIQTRNSPESFSQAYGRFEVRARMPEGKGLWPAIWLTDAAGAAHGEIDVVELSGVDPHRFYSTLHYYPGPTFPQIQHRETTSVDLSDGFHTYVAEWTPCRIDIYLDGVKRRSFENPFAGVTPPTGSDFPFGGDDPVHIRLDNKVGGRSSAGQLIPIMGADNLADPSTPFTEDKVFEIDYVRVSARPSYAVPAGCANP